MSERGTMAEALDGLQEYGRRSVRNLQDGVDGARKMAQTLNGMVPPQVDRAAGMVSEFMPGFGIMEAMRLGADSGRQWDQGNYGDALITMGRAVDRPMGEVLWAVPGGGLVKRAVK